MVQQQSAAIAPHGNDLIRPPQTSDLRYRPASTVMRLVCNQNVSKSAGAAANGSNRIDLRCPRSPDIDALTCLNDPY
jgi:hypothetical protein